MTDLRKCLSYPEDSVGDTLETHLTEPTPPTKDEIEWPAGPELDAKVANKIFGISKGISVPAYSTLDDVAMLVVNEFDGFLMDRTTKMWPTTVILAVKGKDGVEQCRRNRADAHSLAHAICISAMKSSKDHSR